MKTVRAAGAVAVIAISVAVAVPVMVKAIHTLLIPTVVIVALYLVVRIVNGYLNRW
jgi:hypothetical protein